LPSNALTDFGRPIDPMATREHAGFKWVNTNAPELRPLQVPLTRAQYDTLVGLAISLGVETPRAYSVGNQTLVYQMIREISDGKLVVVRPDAADPEPEG
jgi:hypothetical protein